MITIDEQLNIFNDIKSRKFNLSNDKSSCELEYLTPENNENKYILWPKTIGQDFGTGFENYSNIVPALLNINFVMNEDEKLQVETYFKEIEETV